MVYFKPLPFLVAFAMLMLAQGAGAVGLPNVPNTHHNPHHKMQPQFPGVADAITNGRLDFWTRLRFEDVEDDFPASHPLGHTNDADAMAWRTAIGYTTGRWNGLYGRLEVEFSRILG